MNASAAPDNWWDLLDRSSECVLMDDASGGRPSLLFVEPARIIRTTSPEEVGDCLALLDAARREGLWVAGYLTYEAIEHVQVGAPMPAPGEAPDLLWFGVFEKALLIPPGSSPSSEVAGRPFSLRVPPGGDRRSEAERIRFLACVAQVQEQLALGNCYQINLTTETALSVAGNLVALYALLRRLQPAEHAAFVRHDERAVLSLSPELFFRVDGDVIETRPVKGTTARGDDPESDEVKRNSLRRDPKTQAENLMITDLLRNDLGTCAEIGSVNAGPLFAVETLPALHQMYSVVRARLLSDCRDGLFSRLFPAIFPCGSITGAPKLAARKLISVLEQRRRGVYTGAVGFAGPVAATAIQGLTPAHTGELPDAEFNVAIRTLDVNGTRARFGVGCGIVWDSEAAAEYAEAELKRSFLRAACDDFALIETMRADAGRVRLLLDHVRRLRRGLASFAFPEAAGRAALESVRHAVHASPPESLRLRLLVYRTRPAQLSISHLSAEPRRSLQLVVSDCLIYSGDPFRRHKTTVRELYDRELARVRSMGADDVLFLNELGEAVETAIANIVVRIDGEWVTPGTACGALPGTALSAATRGRSQVRAGRVPGVRAPVGDGKGNAAQGNAQGKGKATGGGLVRRNREIHRRKIGLREIASAKRVLVCNSVRGFERVGSITDVDGRTVYFDRGSRTAEFGKAGEDT